MFVSGSFRAALLGAVIAIPAFAQDNTQREYTPNEFERRSSGSLSIIQSRPTGTFQQNIGFGYGVNAAYMFQLDRAGALSLRADAGLAQYGNESFEVPLSTTVGGRIRVKVRTNNYFVPLSIGPQITWPRGPVRPYVNAGIGTQGFFTQSSVEGSDNNNSQFASTTNQSDWTSAWVAGGGIYLPVYQKKARVMIDLGVQYYNGGRAQYLKPGSIQDLPNGDIRITPLESDTHVMFVRLGVKVGV